jgi:hypothetical protein
MKFILTFSIKLEGAKRDEAIARFCPRVATLEPILRAGEASSTPAEKFVYPYG